MIHCHICFQQTEEDLLCDICDEYYCDVVILHLIGILIMVKYITCLFYNHFLINILLKKLQKIKMIKCLLKVITLMIIIY